MKRFYTAVAAVPEDGAWKITLDARPVRTPKRALLSLPTAALAAAVAEEWDAQGDEILPATMPMTGLANAAIDHVQPDPQAFAASLAAYGESDLVCYRADTPADLAARQAEAWDPFVSFARSRYDAALRVTDGIAHIAQEPAAVQRLGAALQGMDAWKLAAMQPLVTIAGSLVIALALAERETDAEAAFAAGHLDELYQAEKWGDDAEATAARAARRAAFDAADRFLSLLDTTSAGTTSRG
ncbi:ATP12 family chaperone protein [Sphingosinicella microcystinivorans]|uniref:ATPase n=1 Tax=Sphingosinicella microcystinivorans TaxID=335406 RepID=A0AAD1D515_SPHMI|nr:ATP12 family protein [Sphingosinicella microcystinivorans]RKS91030.1 chaperone required for assembly of F1-ATPase [Sphingosinicella microcystinivorans]BBE33951.1 ATPase [Sphingosinicella microcystinivorans]